MKEIKAYIQKRKLSQVSLALRKIEGLSGMSVGKGQGFGRGRAKGMPHRIVDDLVEYVPHVKIEIVCADDQLDEIVRAIETTAHTGNKGDGKIYVTNVEQAIRIRTGERGASAA
jgi:nitrogen regulatory protein PII